MYHVYDIEWIGYEEADLILCDGIYQIKCFSHPCYSKIGDSLDETLFCMFSDSVMKIQKRYDIIQQNDMNILCGKVINKKEKLLKIGGFTFQLEVLPNDIDDNDFVKVVCGRIDI